MVRTYRGEIHALSARVLDDCAYALLLLLAAFFAFEQTRGLILGDSLVLTNVELLLTGTFILWGASRIISGDVIRLPRELLLPCLVWIGWLFLSLAFAPYHQDKGLLFMGRILAGLALCQAAYDLVNTPGRWLLVILAMVIGAVIVAGLGLAEALGLVPVVNWLDGFKAAPTRVGDVLRISATLSYATIAAMVLELTMPLLLALVLLSDKLSRRLLGGLAIFLLLVAHVLTLSRAGVLALLFALGVMAITGAWYRERRLVSVSLLTGTSLLLLIILVLTVNPKARLRLTTETEQGWYQANYKTPPSLYARPGQEFTTTLRLTNSGARNWTAIGNFPFALSYHLYDAAGRAVTYDGPRSSLSGTVSPGETIQVKALIAAPHEAGSYRIEWDMVQEEVTWFSWKDAPTGSSNLEVSGSSASEPSMNASKPPSEFRVLNPTPGRIELWQVAWRMFVDRPVVGVGPDNFRWAYGAYAGLDEWDSGIHANNLYIEWLADTGLVGLLLFLWFSSRLIKISYKHLKSSQMDPRTQGSSDTKPNWLLTLGIIAGLVAWYIHGFFDYFYEFTPTYIGFWLLVALLMGSSRWRLDDITNRL